MLPARRGGGDSTRLDHSGRRVGVADHGTARGGPGQHAAVEVGGPVTLLVQPGGDLRRATADLAHDDDVGALVELGRTPGYVVHRDVLSTLDVAGRPLVRLADVQQDRLSRQILDGHGGDIERAHRPSLPDTPGALPRATVPALRDASEPVLPEGCLVVVGDNIVLSHDSRRAGYFPAATLLGIVIRQLR